MIRYVKRKITNLLSKATKVINGRYAIGILAECGEFRYVVEPTDMHVGKLLRFEGGYGSNELERVNKLLNGDSVAVFVGTHVGALAIPTAKRIKKAYFIEANPRTFQYLEMNSALNSVNNATLLNFAAGEDEGEINFVLSKTNSGGSKREPVVKKNMYYFDSPDTIKVPMRPVDALVGSQDGKIDLVFMDIEGSEFFALKGMTETLRITEHLIVEFIGHHLRNVANTTVADFVSLIEPHFNFLFVPSQNRRFAKDRFRAALTEMYDRGIDDDGIVFSKSRTDF